MQSRAAVEHVAALAHRAGPRCGPTVVVAVDGRSGSGKTTFATRLGVALDAPVVHLDAIYPGWDGLQAGVDTLAAGVLAPLAAGRPAAYPTWDWAAGAPGPTVPVAATRLLVVEGCGAAAEPAGSYAALTVWLDADPALRHRRAIGRDGPAFAREWDRWAAQEAAVIGSDRTAERADLRLDTDTWSEEWTG